MDGLGVHGRTEFSLSFTPTPLEYGGGSSVFLVPFKADWTDTLDRMVLSGPDLEDTLTRDGEPPLAVVTDPSTGRIQAMIRNWDGGPLRGEGTGDVTITMGIFEQAGAGDSPWRPESPPPPFPPSPFSHSPVCW